MKTQSQLYLENGEIFKGFAPEWQKGKSFFGEVVFTTGMAGYVETLTDPSFSHQFVTFTYPLIGNYGVPRQEYWESKKIYASGAIVSRCAPHFNHFDAEQSLMKWLESQNIPLLYGVDTRALTMRLRKKGSLAGAISENTPHEFIDPNKENLVSKVSITQPEIFGEGDKLVIALDCGMKENLVRSLKKFPIRIKRVPYNYDFSEEPFDGVFISNGPGDPKKCTETLEILQKVLKRKKPTFGVCLGMQLLALAIGADTYKLPFGHRGQNQPCMHLSSKNCYLTSQNHGYAVEEKTLPPDWEVNFRNLNDQTVEGIKHEMLPLFAVQFHPEASPGPLDTQWLFETFYQRIERHGL